MQARLGQVARAEADVGCLTKAYLFQLFQTFQTF